MAPAAGQRDGDGLFVGTLGARIRSGLRSGAHVMKTAAYDECFQSVAAIWRDEGGPLLDDIALMDTINSVLACLFPHFYGAVFYRVCGDRLIIGPYIGTVGCLQIEFGRGVCGKAVE